MNKRDAGLQVGRNRLFLIFCFFCIKTKEKYTVVQTFNLQIYCENLAKLSKQFRKNRYINKNRWFHFFCKKYPYENAREE